MVLGIPKKNMKRVSLAATLSLSIAIGSLYAAQNYLEQNMEAIKASIPLRFPYTLTPDIARENGASTMTKRNQLSATFNLDDDDLPDVRSYFVPCDDSNERPIAIHDLVEDIWYFNFDRDDTIDETVQGTPDGSYSFEYECPLPVQETTSNSVLA
ncbi:hypothetical protein ACFL1B_04335 [Nanoarchaeota archaeon]